MLLAMSLFTATYAVASEPYVFLGYGLGFQGDKEFATGEYDMDLSHNVEAGVGKNFGDWRTELSFGYQNMSGDKSWFGANLEQNVDVYKVRLGVDRALPQFKIANKYTPYVGFGIGPNFYDGDLTLTKGKYVGINRDNTGPDMVLGYDLTVGVTRVVPKYGAFGVAYRYDDTFDDPTFLRKEFDAATHVMEFKWYWQ